MEYIRNKSFNDLHFKDMIVQYLRSSRKGERKTNNDAKVHKNLWLPEEFYVPLPVRAFFGFV